jgi:hypothetical protein
MKTVGGVMMGDGSHIETIEVFLNQLLAHGNHPLE